MRGSVATFDPGVITELKNESVVVSMALSATPVVLLNERTRPLSAITNCVGPTVPIVSGGQPSQSLKVAAVKLSVGLTLCAFKGDALTGDGAATLVEVPTSAGDATNRGTTRRAFDRAGWSRSRAL